MSPVNHILAKDDHEANAKSIKYKNLDPFPQIYPALLNSADIYDYVAATGMIYPFEADKEKFKPASYSISFEGQALYWKDKSNEDKVVLNLKKGDVLTLSPNSLVYVTLEPKLRLPNYLAARFNLQIKQVHRGLLLGTGPLVDPGFEGHLLIPLHNFSSNTYQLKSGEPLIWMEFTKISHNNFWKLDDVENSRLGKFFEFNRDSKDRTASTYLNQAVENGPILSTFASLSLQYEGLHKKSSIALAQADETNERAHSLIRTFNIGVAISLAAFVGALATVLGIAFTMRSNIDNYVNAANDRQNSEHEKIINTHINDVELLNRNNILSLKLDSLSNELKKIRSKYPY